MTYKGWYAIKPNKPNQTEKVGQIKLKHQNNKYWSEIISWRKIEQSSNKKSKEIFLLIIFLLIIFILTQWKLLWTNCVI